MGGLSSSIGPSFSLLFATIVGVIAMRVIWAIGLNTFREAVRNRVLYTLFFFAILMTVFSMSVSTIILGPYERAILNLGLGNIELFGTALAIFVGISLVRKEIELRTIQVILARPIHRGQFVLGKFLGLCLTLGVQVLLMTGIFTAVLAWWEGAYLIPWALAAIAMLAVQLVWTTAVAVFFSCVSTPILSGMFTAAFYFIAVSSRYLEEFGRDLPPESLGYGALKAARMVVPSFDPLNFKGLATYQGVLPSGDVAGIDLFALGAGYGLAWTVAVLALAIVAFERREFP